MVAAHTHPRMLDWSIDIRATGMTHLVSLLGALKHGLVDSGALVTIDTVLRRPDDGG